MTQSGMGGVIVLSPSGDAAALSLSLPLDSAVFGLRSLPLPAGMLSKLVAMMSGLRAGKEPLRFRLTAERSARTWPARTWPAFGAAVMMLVGVVDGGGVGELERKRGWMWFSLPAELEALDRDIDSKLEVDWLREKRAYVLGGGGSNGDPGLGERELDGGEAGIVSRM